MLPMNLPQLELVTVESSATRLTLFGKTTAPSGICPLCDTKSSRIHSYHIRTLHDLPISGLQVCLKVKTKRFRCCNMECNKQTFTEIIPTLLERVMNF